MSLSFGLPLSSVNQCPTSRPESLPGFRSDLIQYFLSVLTQLWCVLVDADRCVTEPDTRPELSDVTHRGMIAFLEEIDRFEMRMFRQLFECVNARDRYVELTTDGYPFIGRFQWRYFRDHRVNFLNSGVSFVAISNIEFFDEFAFAHGIEESIPVLFRIRQDADPTVASPVAV